MRKWLIFCQNYIKYRQISCFNNKKLRGYLHAFFNSNQSDQIENQKIKEFSENFSQKMKQYEQKILDISNGRESFMKSLEEDIESLYYFREKLSFPNGKKLSSRKEFKKLKSMFSLFFKGCGKKFQFNEDEKKLLCYLIIAKINKKGGYLNNAEILNKIKNIKSNRLKNYLYDGSMITLETLDWMAMYLIEMMISLTKLLISISIFVLTDAITLALGALVSGVSIYLDIALLNFLTVCVDVFLLNSFSISSVSGIAFLGFSGLSGIASLFITTLLCKALIINIVAYYSGVFNSDDPADYLVVPCSFLPFINTAMIISFICCILAEPYLSFSSVSSFFDNIFPNKDLSSRPYNNIGSHANRFFGYSELHGYKNSALEEIETCENNDQGNTQEAQAI